jgi:hypothetical protein
MRAFTHTLFTTFNAVTPDLVWLLRTRVSSVLTFHAEMLTFPLTSGSGFSQFTSSKGIYAVSLLKDIAPKSVMWACPSRMHQECARVHGMRNELEANEQERERGWLLEDAESRQDLSALMISSEGREYIIEKAVVFAGSSLVSCWRGMQERQQP